MVARAAAVSTSRALVRQSTRIPPRLARTPVPLGFQLHTSVSTLVPTSQAAATPTHDAPIPGATYVHIPPLEVPAEGLVPSQGSVQLRVMCAVSPHTLTLAHSLAIVKAVEAKCGPVVGVHHRRDPVNGTLLRGLHVTLLHPITLTQPLVLEIPCHKISREHRMNGGPSLEELERAILEPPSSTSTARSGKKNASDSVQNEAFDLLYAEVKTVATRRSTQLADVYGVTRNNMPSETSPGVFGPDRGGRIRKAVYDRRGRKSLEEELQEDEEILSRLLEWNGFYGGFEGLQATYGPLSQVIPQRISSDLADQGKSSTSTASSNLAPPSAEDLAAQKEAEKQNLEERMNAEREYWRTRREREKNAKRDEEKGAPADGSTPSGPSPTLLQRLIKGEQNSASSIAATPVPVSGSPSSSSPTEVPQTPAAKTSITPLTQAQSRLVEQARRRAQAESSPLSKLQLLGGSGGGSSQQSSQKQPHSGSPTAVKGFTGSASDASKGNKRDGMGWVGRVAAWFTDKGT